MCQRRNTDKVQMRVTKTTEAIKTAISEMWYYWDRVTLLHQVSLFSFDWISAWVPE